MARLRTLRRTSAFMTLVLGILTTGIVSIGAVRGYRLEQEAFVVRRKVESLWKSISPEQVENGIILPADTNVMIQLPMDVTTIDRDVLLGLKGSDVRYWGYCLPQNYDPALVAKRSGLPGLLFLSEKERTEREASTRKPQPKFSLMNLPTADDIALAGQRKPNLLIRHQLERFDPGMLCYVMSEAPLPVGLDPDNDYLNNSIEQAVGSDPNSPDTDEDGLPDGLEYRKGTSPVRRDTDDDGLIDGLEDADFDGNIDVGETDPRERDSDRDGLCDGLCSFPLGHGQSIYAGEDRNLNGKFDEGETDPTKWSTLDDGVSDLVPFLQCLAGGEGDC